MKITRMRSHQKYSQTLRPPHPATAPSLAEVFSISSLVLCGQILFQLEAPAEKWGKF